jgi:hypothetical protein
MGYSASWSSSAEWMKAVIGVRIASKVLSSAGGRRPLEAGSGEISIA